MEWKGTCKHFQNLEVRTLLAAIIQETNESVFLIEYLFCKQLFPYFQSKMKRIYSEAKEAVEDEYKKKENDLMVQVKTLQSKKKKKKFPKKTCS